MLTALPGFVPVITLICALSFAPDGDRAHPPPLSVAATTHAENDIRYPAGDGTINLAPQPALEVSPLLPPVTRTGSAGSTPGTTAEPGTGDSGPAASESTRPETHVRPPAYRRSLILSGVLGLLISMTGIAMVSHRRRLW